MTILPKEEMRKTARDLKSREDSSFNKLQVNDISLPNVKVIVKNASSQQQLLKKFQENKK
jgi:hypothetical protein